jgi:methylglutaconyl-CoA hydratase
MQTAQAEFVQTRLVDGIAHVEFYHPASNSLPGHILRALAQAITDAGNNPEAKVIVLRSAGESAFCAGASFDELIAIDSEEQGKTFFSGFALVINAMRKAPKFVIGRIHGKAVGGGVGLAAACDYALATSKSSAKLSELAVGIGPFVVGPAVERKTGTAAFSAMTIDASEWRSAEWAKNCGLYADVFDTSDQLDAGIERLALQLSKSNPEAMAMLKSIFWEGTEHWDTLLFERAAMSGKLVLSSFTRNAIQQFKKK